VQGKEFSVLTKVVSYNFFKTIRVDLIKSATASYIVGVLNRVVVGVEEDKAIFDLLLSLLLFLEKTTPSSVIIISFLIKLLSKLGLEPVLTHCVVDPTHPLEKDFQWFNFQAGGIVCSMCQAQVSKNREPGVLLTPTQIMLLQKLLQNPWEDIQGLVVEKKVTELIYTFFGIHNERALPRPLAIALN
jgi:DNA repair protein RecO (recombination protein O)